MALLLRELSKWYHHVFYDLADQRHRDYPLLGSPLWIVAIVTSYLYFATLLGPRLMRNSAPFSLDRVIQIYDAIQVAISAYLCWRSVVLAWFNNYSLQCQPIDRASNPVSIEIGWITYLFYLTKILDMADTVFIVLRKKDAQMSFLHVYHHAMTAIVVWGAAKYLGGGHHTMVGTLNSAVHAVMYSYYLVTSLYPQQKNNLAWKKLITRMQMVQFLLLIVHSAQMVVLPGCGYPKIISIAVIIPQNLMMFVMFANFYRKAYVMPGREATNPKKHKY